MVQVARPDADITDGGWEKQSGGNTDLYTVIDESIADDTDYIESDLGPVSDVAAVNLSDVTDPQSSLGHVVRYRYEKNLDEGYQIDVTVQLRQGYVSEGAQGSLIAQQSHTDIPNGWTAGSFTLGAAEADAITDYADIQLRFIGNQP